MTERQIIVQGSSLMLTSLNGGDNLCAGDSKNITWNSSGVTNVKIELSSDGGNNYNETIVASTPASGGSYNWNIPQSEDGNMYRIRISDVANSSLNSESSSNFTVGGPRNSKLPNC